MKKILIVLLLVVVVAVGAWLFTWWRSPKIGHVKDEAQLAGLTADYFNAADEKEYLRDMDRGPKGPIDLSPDEIKGRNTWVMWTAGNDRLWDKLTLASAGRFLGHVDGGKRPALGQADLSQCRRAGFHQDSFLLPGTEGQPRESLDIPRLG